MTTTSKKSTMIVPVWLSHQDNPEHEVLVYALLDSQSDTTFMSQRSFEDLQAPGIPTSLLLSTMTSTNTTIQSTKVFGLEVRAVDGDTKISLPPAFTRELIPVNRNNIPTPAMANKWPHLSRIASKLMPLCEADIGLLIGYNCTKALVPKEVIVPQGDGPFAKRNDLCWSIVGITEQGNRELDDSIGPSHVVIHSCPHPTHIINESIFHNQVEKDLPSTLLIPQEEVAFVHRTSIKEALPNDVIKALSSDFIERNNSKNCSLSQEDRKFVQIIEEGIHKTSEGFYELPLQERPRMPDSRHNAEKRLANLKRKFEKNEQYHSDYKNFLQKTFDQGEAEDVSHEEVEKRDGSLWYIPHHGVYNPKKPEKLRAVTAV